MRCEGIGYVTPRDEGVEGRVEVRVRGDGYDGVSVRGGKRRIGSGDDGRDWRRWGVTMRGG